MTRKERARVVIDFISRLAVKHGRPLTSRGEPDGATYTLVQRHASWKAVVSTWPYVETEDEPNRVYMPHHMVVYALGHEVLSCDFDEEDLRIFKFKQGPWDEMIFHSVKRPPDFP